MAKTRSQGAALAIKNRVPAPLKQCPHVAGRVVKRTDVVQRTPEAKSGSGTTTGTRKKSDGKTKGKLTSDEPKVQIINSCPGSDDHDPDQSRMEQFVCNGCGALLWRPAPSPKTTDHGKGEADARGKDKTDGKTKSRGRSKGNGNGSKGVKNKGVGEVLPASDAALEPIWLFLRDLHASEREMKEVSQLLIRMMKLAQKVVKVPECASAVEPIHDTRVIYC